MGGAAAADEDGTAAGDGPAERFIHGSFQTVTVRGTADQAAVPVQHGVDTARDPGGMGDFVQKRDDAFLVWDRDIEPGKIFAGVRGKSFEVFGLHMDGDVFGIHPQRAESGVVHDG